MPDLPLSQPTVSHRVSLEITAPAAIHVTPPARPCGHVAHVVAQAFYCGPGVAESWLEATSVPAPARPSLKPRCAGATVYFSLQRQPTGLLGGAAGGGPAPTPMALLYKPSASADFDGFTGTRTR
jgi:hypothetical protein